MLPSTMVAAAFLGLMAMLPITLANTSDNVVLKTAKTGGTTTLDCEQAEEKKVTWRFTTNATSLAEEDVVEEEGKFEMEGSTLKIRKVGQEELGIYYCVDEDEELLKKFEVDISVRLRKFPKSISADQGTDLRDELECSLHSAGQDVVFQWFTKSEENPEEEKKLLCIKSDSSDCNLPQSEALFDSRDKDVPAKPLSDRAEVEEGQDEDGVAFSTLIIKNLQLEDRQIYVCQAVLKEPTQNFIKNCTASKECDQVETLIRVKDPLAALWPFVGIVIEVVLLCVIIFFCERKKSVEEKEDYEDGSNSNNVASNSSLRQRK